MGVHLHVGNLSPQTTANDLREQFGTVGEVADVTVVFNEDRWSSSGVAYVQMGSAADAARAIEQLNGAMLGGRPLQVEEAGNASSA